MAASEIIPVLILGPFILAISGAALFVVIAAGIYSLHGIQSMWYSLKEERKILREIDRDMYV